LHAAKRHVGIVSRNALVNGTDPGGSGYAISQRAGLHRLPPRSRPLPVALPPVPAGATPAGRPAPAGWRPLHGTGGG